MKKLVRFFTNLLFDFIDLIRGALVIVGIITVFRLVVSFIGWIGLSISSTLASLTVKPCPAEDNFGVGLILVVVGMTSGFILFGMYSMVKYFYNVWKHS